MKGDLSGALLKAGEEEGFRFRVMRHNLGDNVQRSLGRENSEWPFLICVATTHEIYPPSWNEGNMGLWRRRISTFFLQEH